MHPQFFVGIGCRMPQCVRTEVQLRVYALVPRACAWGSDPPPPSAPSQAHELTRLCMRVRMGMGMCLETSLRRSWTGPGARMYWKGRGPEGVREAARQAVGGGYQGGWGRLLWVTNAIGVGSCGQEESGWAIGRSPGRCLPPFNTPLVWRGLCGSESSAGQPMVRATDGRACQTFSHSISSPPPPPAQHPRIMGVGQQVGTRVCACGCFDPRQGLRQHTFGPLGFWARFPSSHPPPPPPSTCILC